MSEVEVILRQEAGVKDHESESPPTVGLKAGAFAELGTLILTNKRLVYISKGELPELLRGRWEEFLQLKP